MICNFRCKETKAIFRREGSRRFHSIERLALQKLLQIEASDRLEDLKVPPGNRLEKLVGNRAGQHSIRINGQFRICFRWENGAASDVEIVDYH
jgi:proteic killer suppression protein